MRRIVLSVLLSLLLVCVPAITSHIRPVQAEALLVLEMEVSNTTITIGEEINITLVLKNIGNSTFVQTYFQIPAPVFDAYYFTASDMVFKYGPFGGGIPIEVEVIIEPGANITTILKWDLYKEDFQTGLCYPPPPGNYNLYGYCDLTHPDTFHLFMNDLFIPVTVVGDWWHFADCNYDFKVDIYDLVTAANSYGSAPSDTNWNPHCDIAEPYGIIDIFDIVMIATSYGEEYTP